MKKILFFISIFAGISSTCLGQLSDEEKVRKSDEKYITTDKILFYLEEGSIIEEYYRSLESKQKGEPYKKFTNDEVFAGVAEGLDSYLTTLLVELNYIDTSGRFFPDYKNSLHLDMTITKIRIAHIRTNKNSLIRTSFLEIDADFQLMTYYGKKIHSKSLVIEKEIDIASELDGGEIFEVLIKDIFETFIFDQEVQSRTESDEYYDLSDESSYFPMNINGGNSVKDFGHWQKSVATVITDEGHGSAVVISEDGYLLTNFHVVAQNDTVRVKFMDNSSAVGVVQRRHPDCDMALIKVEKTGLDFLTQSTATYDLGEVVYVVGTPLDTTLSQSVSKGVLSGYRSFDDFTYMQTDAKMNPGNSGGALINASGELIGIVSAKYIGYGIEGIGFAIPISKLEEKLKVTTLVTSTPQTPHSNQGGQK